MIEKESISGFKLAFLILRRFFLYSSISIISLGYFFFSMGLLVGYLEEISESTVNFKKYPFAFITPKVKAASIINTLFKGERPDVSEFIPKNLYVSLKVNPERSLIPLLYIATYKSGSVVATDENIDLVIPDLNKELMSLNNNEVIVGEKIAQRLRLKAGDEIEIASSLSDYVKQDINMKVKVKVIKPLSLWDEQILCNFKLSDFLLDQVSFVDAQIWKKEILSFVIAVTKNNNETQDSSKNKSKNKNKSELETIINKRTVAQYFDLNEQVDDYLKTLGIDQDKNRKIILVTMFSSVIMLGVFFYMWIPILSRVQYTLKRLRYSKTYFYKVMIFLTLYILIFGSSLGFIIKMAFGEL